MSDLFRLIYTSRNLVPGDEDAQAAAVGGILALSKRNNARVGVTGALLFNAGSFAQVLEGERRDVDRTFARIKCDPRHEDVNILFSDAVPERGFSDWSMALVGTTGYGKALWKALLTKNANHLERLDGAAVYGLLRGLTFEEFAGQIGAVGG